MKLKEILCWHDYHFVDHTLSRDIFESNIDLFEKYPIGIRILETIFNNGAYTALPDDVYVYTNISCCSKCGKIKYEKDKILKSLLKFAKKAQNEKDKIKKAELLYKNKTKE